MRTVAVALSFLLIAPPASAEIERKITKLADGVYEIQHSSIPAPSGNTTVVIGSRQVLVVDTCFLPSAARQDIAQIRQWTSLPVTFALITHFHNDHNIGDEAYMQAFPGITIIAHSETKKEMDLFGPGSYPRQERTDALLRQMLTSGKTQDGQKLGPGDIAEVKKLVAQDATVLAELKPVRFQTATMTFDHDFTIDLGGREVEVKFLGRGNTGGDAVLYLPKERILAVGDLVDYPLPNVYDGYPSEWIGTLGKLAALDATSIVPGHGPILHDKRYIFQLQDLFRSAVTQMDAKLVKDGPAMFLTLDQVKGAVNLSAFEKRFIGSDPRLKPQFDDMVSNLIKVVYEEDTLR